MNKLLNALLLLGGLSIISACKQKNAEVNVAADSSKPAGLHVAYVNIDSMQEGLQYFREKRDEFGKEEQAINNEISNLQREIQNVAQNFQKKIEAKNISEVEAEQTQKRLANMQVNLQNKQQNLSSAFMQKQSKFNEEFSKMVDDFFKEYNKGKNYDFIFTQGPVKSILYHAPKYDITNEVIKEMNEWISRRKTENVLNNVLKDTAASSAQ